MIRGSLTRHPHSLANPVKLPVRGIMDITSKEQNNIKVSFRQHQAQFSLDQS